MGSLVDPEFHFGVMKSFGDSGDSSMNVLNATELYT